MDIDDFAKKFAKRENEVHKSAVEAIAKTIGNPAFQTVLEQQRKVAAEAVHSLIRGPEVSSVHNAMQAAVRAANERVALLCNTAVMPNIDTEIRSLVRGLNVDSISGINAVLSRQADEARKLTETLLSSIKPPQIDLPTLRRPLWERDWVHPPVRPFIPEPQETPAEQFMRRLIEHVENADKEAAETGGQRVVMCKCPGGDEVRVMQISLEDEHFVRVKGIDQFNQVREFTGHHNAIAITIEVVPQLEDLERDENSDPLN